VNKGIKLLATTLVLQVLQAYKWAVSPLFPPACRYVPTCSEYAMEAVEHHGVMRGGLMAVWRLLRCHPLAHGGYDPVSRRRRSVSAELADNGTVHARSSAVRPGKVLDRKPFAGISKS
jgi:uncharacterized protein